MMQTTTSPAPPTGQNVFLQRKAFGGIRFDYVFAVLASWLIGGLYLDGWAHLHMPELETFFTPWHGVLYSGFLALITWLAGVTLWNRWQLSGWTGSVPNGYVLSLVGAGLFAFGGVGDMLWHIAFGIESDVEALLSPTHLVLAVGAGLLVSGPIRAAWRRDEQVTWRTWLPVLLSAVTLLSLITFFTSYVHPFIRTSAAEVFRPVDHEGEHANLDMGIAAVLLQTAVLMSIVLLMIRRWAARLPLGTLTLLLGINIALVTLVFNQSHPVAVLPLIAAAVLAGGASDLALRALRSSSGRTVALHAFAAFVPIVLYALYFGVLFFAGGIWWSIHLWTGTIALAGITGWLTSVVAAPGAATP
jgi:hypothetical protein